MHPLNIVFSLCKHYNKKRLPFLSGIIFCFYFEILAYGCVGSNDTTSETLS